MSIPAKPRETYHQVSFDAFGYLVRLIFTSDVVQSRIDRSKLLGEYDGAPASGLHSWNANKAQSYLFLSLDATPGNIAHEAWHAVRRMLLFCGAELDNEVVAYHLGHLVGEIHTAQRKAQTKK